MNETYKAARVRLHREMGAKGWTVSSPTLKVLWVRDPNGETIRFKPQAVYLNQHSTYLDIRGMTVEMFITAINGRILHLHD